MRIAASTNSRPEPGIDEVAVDQISEPINSFVTTPDEMFNRSEFSRRRLVVAVRIRAETKLLSFSVQILTLRNRNQIRMTTRRYPRSSIPVRSRPTHSTW